MRPVSPRAGGGVRRQAQRCHCGVVDLDHFKKINDEHRARCRAIRLLNMYQVVCGYLKKRNRRHRSGVSGGEEFICLLPITPFLSCGIQVVGPLARMPAASSVPVDGTESQIDRGPFCGTEVNDRIDSIRKVSSPCRPALYEGKENQSATCGRS